MFVFTKLTTRLTMIVLGIFVLVPGGALARKQPEPTPIAAADGHTRVTGVDAHVDWGSNDVPCPRKLAVHGSISVDNGASQPTVVTYEWIGSDGTTWGKHDFTALAGLSTKKVSDQWSVGKPGEHKSIWVMLRATSPYVVNSQQQRFDLVCPAVRNERGR